MGYDWEMRPVIESLQNPRIKLAIRLRESRARRKSGLILIDGAREIGVALRAGLQLESIFAAELTSDDWPAELFQPVSSKVLEKVAYGERSSAVAIAKTPETGVARLTDVVRQQTSPLIMVLDRAEKPGNIGAVVRTIATAGAQGLVLVDPQCEVFNPNAIRASLGTIFSVPVAVASLLNWWTGCANIASAWSALALMARTVCGQPNCPAPWLSP